MELPRLREWRESQGLMQKEVAENAGISEWTVLRAEGGASVRTPTARKIAEALGVSVSDLLESPPVPLAPASVASPPPDAEATGAWQRNRGPDLLDDSRIREWLRERGATWVATTEGELREHVRRLDPGIDEDGNPTRVVGLVEEVMHEEAKTHALLWSPKEYRSLGPLLPVDPDAAAAEQKQQRREQLRRLRREVQRAYGRRRSALASYANALASEQEAMGKNPGSFELAVGAATRREQMVEAAFAGQEAG